MGVIPSDKLLETHKYGQVTRSFEEKAVERGVEGVLGRNSKFCMRGELIQSQGPASGLAQGQHYTSHIIPGGSSGLAPTFIQSSLSFLKWRQISNPPA